MEFVWVVPRDVLFPESAPHGFLHLPPAELKHRFLGPALRGGFFMERRYAESHPEYKQVIPYVVVARRDEVFCLTRLETQGESRLHGLRSIGVGGHINPCDARGAAGGLMRNALLRELHEELVLPKNLADAVPLGLLNDDSTPVGSVHAGFVYHLDAAEHPVAVRETNAMAGGYESLAGLQAAASSSPSAFESWSSLLLGSGALAPPRSGCRAGRPMAEEVSTS